MFERDVRVVFTPALDEKSLVNSNTNETKLRYIANAKVNGAQHRFLLTFEAAFPTMNCYSIQVDVFWEGNDLVNNDYQRNSSESWFRLWTQEFSSTKSDFAVGGSWQLYRQLCDGVFKDEQQLNAVETIQSAILAAMQRGASFRTSHKEGGTNIYWRNGRYARSDYGDYPSQQYYKDERHFLQMLRQFCNWDVTCHAIQKNLTEIDAWRLIYRRMDLSAVCLDVDDVKRDV